MPLDASIFDDSDLKQPAKAGGLDPSIFDDSDLHSATNQPANFKSMYNEVGNTLLNPGIGDTGAGIATGLGNALQKMFAPAYTSSGVMLRDVNPQQNRFIPTPLEQQFSSLGEAKNRSPFAFGIGEGLGESAPLLAAPQVKLAELLGLGGRKLLTSGINNLATGATVSGVATPFYNPHANLNDVGTNSVIGAGLQAASSLLGALGKTGFNAVNRLKNTVLDTESKQAQIAHKMYNDVFDAADNEGIKVNPENFQNELMSELKQSKSGSPQAKNADEKDDLMKLLQDSKISPDERPNIFTARDTDLQIQKLRDTADEYRKGNVNSENRSQRPNKTMAATYNRLADKLQDDMLDAFKNNDVGHLGDQYLAARKNYATNYVPISNNPLTLKGLGAQLGAIGAAQYIPVINHLALAGLAAPKAPVASLARRYISPYQGGLGSIAQGTPAAINEPFGRLLQSYLLQQNGGRQ